MGVQTTDTDSVALFDSVTGWAFGPVFPSEEAAQDFLEFTSEEPDPRMWSEVTMTRLYVRWIAAHGSAFGLELGHQAARP